MPSPRSYHWSTVSELRGTSEGQKAKPDSPGAQLHPSNRHGGAQGGPESWIIQEPRLWTEKRHASSCLLTSVPWFLWNVHATISDALSGIHCIISKFFSKTALSFFHFSTKWILPSLGSLKWCTCSLATMIKFLTAHLMHTWLF